MAELAPEISEKPLDELVVDDCHLYSKVPVYPTAPAVLVNSAGSKGEEPLCAAAIVPPELGFTPQGRPEKEASLSASVPATVEKTPATYKDPSLAARANTVEAAPGFQVVAVPCEALIPAMRFRG